MSTQFQQLGKIRPQVEYKFWAYLGHEGQTLADLATKMEEIGNTVIETDEENQRLLVAQVSQDVWGCGVCILKGELVITDTESELQAHYEELHPGVWT